MQNSDTVSTTLVMTRSTQDDFKITNKKFSRRHSEKIKENNKNTNCNNTTNNNNNANSNNNLKHKCSLRNRRTLIPLVLPEQVNSQQLIDIDKNSLFILNNTATQSLFNLTKYEKINSNQINNLHPSVLYGLTNLKEIRLIGNEIKEIHPYILNGLVSLKELWLTSGNQIEKNKYKNKFK